MRQIMKWTVGLSILLLAVTSMAAEAFKLVVNEKNSVSSLSQTEVSAMLLKKSARWPDGTRVTAVDQVGGSEVRDAMSRQIHGRTSAAVRSYWQQQIFSGRDVPPVEKNSDEQVLAFVRANPGAIGYVSPSASTAGVKVLVVR